MVCNHGPLGGKFYLSILAGGSQDFTFPTSGFICPGQAGIANAEPWAQVNHLTGVQIRSRNIEIYGPSLKSKGPWMFQRQNIHDC